MEEYDLRSAASGGSFTATLHITPHSPLSLQLREVRPNGSWGVAYGYRVYLNDILFYERDSSIVDPGGGPYSSVFLDTADSNIVSSANVRIKVVSTSQEPAYFTDIWAYSDLSRFIHEQGIRVPTGIYAVIGKDYHSTQALQDNLTFVKDNLHRNERVRLGTSVLDYFAVRTSSQMAASYDRYLELARSNDIPITIESTSDWEGTPGHVPDGKEGTFGDIPYQQILWSETDQTADVWNGEKLSDYLGSRYDVRYGLSVPNIWGDTPWLT